VKTSTVFCGRCSSADRLKTLISTRLMLLQMGDGSWTFSMSQTKMITNAYILPSFGKSIGVEVASDQHTTIELTGTDRSGLLSEIFKCSVT
jgi:hypothetical protein